MKLNLKRDLLRASVAMAVASSPALAFADVACKVSYLNDWGTGYQANVEVTNVGTAAVDGWDVSLDFGESPRFTNGWNADIKASGNVVKASNLNWNAKLAPGKSTSFGFQGNSDGSLNTIVCKGDSAVVIPTSVPTSVVTPTPVVTATPVVTPPPSGDGITCEVSTNAWNTGYQLNVTVTNNGPAVNGWEVELDFPEGANRSGGWNANFTDAGNKIVASNLNWNAALGTGKSTSFGLQGSHDGSFVEPSCNGEGGGVVTPTPTATPTPVVTDVPVTPTPVVTPTPTPVVTDVPVTPTPLPGDGIFRVDSTGAITKNGEYFPVQCGSWFGLEGQHEPADAAHNPDGAPMELYMGNMWWSNNGQGTGRTIQQTMTELKQLGINVIRLPIAPQTLDPSDPQGIGFSQNGGVLKNHESVRQDNARQAMEDFIKLADQNDLEVIVDIHSCSNYLGWRAGRLDAKPPYADADRDNYDYKREGYSCSATGNPGTVHTVQAYGEQEWLEDLKEIAGLSVELGVDNIIGIDIFNEPWDYTWAEWKDLSEKAYQAISSVNSDVLIFVEGVGSSTSAGEEVPHGSDNANPNWGENFYPAGAAPLNIPKERLVLSPHTYGPSVFVQPQFVDTSNPDCEGLNGDEAGDAGCDIVIDADKLSAGWDEHFGYLREQGYAMVVGEFGGHFEWPRTAPLRDQQRWSHIKTNVDEEWQNTFVNYMVERNIQGCYWSINPESADTGGLYKHAYIPDVNESGWGTWEGLDSEKTDLLKRLWEGAVVEPTPTPVPTPTPEPGEGLFRVNDSGKITRNGDVFPVRCGSWFGLEGQHEPADAAHNPDGAPMELYMGNMWWANSGQGTGRTIQQTMTELKAQGLTTIRMPIAPQTLNPGDPQGRGFSQSGGVLKNHESVRQSNARQAMEDFIKLADQNDLQIIVDIHSCSNYLGWRAGRLDAKPPYADADRNNYNYKREGYSCSATGNPDSVHTVQAYDEQRWLADLKEIAGLSQELGVDNIIGIDIFNEPWDYTWSEWKDLSEKAFTAIDSVNSDVLIFVEGVGSNTSSGDEVPHGDDPSNPNWGENLYPADEAPLNIPKDRLVYSPHTYGPSVFVQPQFVNTSKPGCDGLDGDAAGDAGCDIVIDAARLAEGWDAHFGYLREEGFAMVVGEFGGHFEWPRSAPVRDQQRWSHITTNVDEEWQNALVDYMIKKDIEACYWSINPESADTGGLYKHSYIPNVNESGWGTWEGLDMDKIALVRRLWGL